MNLFIFRRLPSLRFPTASMNFRKLFSTAAPSSHQFNVEKPATNKSDIMEPEDYDLTDRRKWVIENISNSIGDLTQMIFAVIYIQGKQHKVTQDDIIHVEHNIPLDVGEEIALEKVLMIGNAEFTLIGRPLLDPKFVHVRATVIEKTTTSPEVQYDFRKKNILNPVCEFCVFKKANENDRLSHELTVLRINNIHLDKMLLGAT